MAVPQYLIPSSLHVRQADQQRNRLEDRILRPPPAVERAVYRENWNNVQIAFFDPGVVGNIFYDTNGQNFLIKGVETRRRRGSRPG